jgi:aryl-alcohol dehydrogenase-like predicted oxidoreductase
MINRRNFLGLTLSAGASLALTPDLLRAFQQSGGKLIERAIPSSGELLPAVGLSFSNHPSCADQAALKEVLKIFAENGGRVYDSMHVSAPETEQFHITSASELGIHHKLFWSTRGTFGGTSNVSGYIESLLSRLKLPKIDLVMLPARDDRTLLAALKEEKKAGRVRYIGVQVIGDNFYPQLESIMRDEPIDFIGVDYDVGNRVRVEDTILPLAQEKKIGVMAFFPFGNNGGVSCSPGTSNLFARVGNRPLPDWAAEFDAKTWSHFFLKYVISHPAVTVARVGTTKPHHMLDNLGGGIGRLPDEATRKRMAAFIDALPVVTVAPPPQQPGGPATAPVLSAAILDRYVGEYKSAAGNPLIIRRYGMRLTAKPGANPETVIHARSETRFQIGPAVIEFQVDSGGKVTGLVYEQGSQKTAASKIR